MQVNSSSITFTSGFNPSVKKIFNELPVKKVQEYFQKKGIEYQCYGCENTPKMLYLTSIACEKMGLPLPSGVGAYPFSRILDEVKELSGNAGACFFEARKDKTLKTYVVLNTDFTEDIVQLNNYFDEHADTMPITHFMKVAFHEFGHVKFLHNYLQKFKIKEKGFWTGEKRGMESAIENLHKLKNNNNGVIDTFIRKELGEYATKNIEEFNAELFADDFINSIDQQTLEPISDRIIPKQRNFIVSNLKNFIDNPPRQLERKPEKCDFEKRIGISIIG